MPTKPYSAWRGAMDFAGFPVNVQLFSRIQKAKGQSLRMVHLAEHGAASTPEGRQRD